jgi:hypothetical protein
MNHEQSDYENLELPLQAALTAIAATSIPDEAVERVKARARQLANMPTPADRTAAVSGRFGIRKGMRTLIGGMIAAGLLAAAALFGLWLPDHSRGNAFAEMVEKVKAAASVRFTMTTQFGRGPETSLSMSLSGSRIREELPGLVIVGDMDRKEALFLDTTRKIAQKQEISGAVARQFGNPIEQLRRAKTGDAQPIGEEVLKDGRARIYRLKKIDLLGMKGTGEELVWVDVKSGLPVKIMIRDPDPKAETEIRMDNFAWNEPGDERLFALNVPEGYREGIVIRSPERPAPLPQPEAASTFLADGVLSRDRVPASIYWTSKGTITALMRDPESVPPQSRRACEVRQWEAASGKLRWSERVNSSWLAAAADGMTLATVVGYEVQIRDAATGKIKRTWVTDQPLSPLAFSPDDRLLAAGITEWGPFGGKGGKESGGVQIWEVEHASVKRIIFDDKPVTFVKFSSDGKYVATSSNFGPIKLWDVATGELSRIFPGVGHADFAPDGKEIACRVATTAAEAKVGKVELFSLRDGSPLKSLAAEKGTSASCLLCIQYSPNGHLLAATDWNGMVTIWDVPSGQRKLAIAGKDGMHAIAFSPDGTKFATGSEDAILQIRAIEGAQAK